MRTFTPEELALVDDVLAARGRPALSQQPQPEQVVWQVLSEVVDSELTCDGIERVDSATLDSFERLMACAEQAPR